MIKETFEIRKENDPIRMEIIHTVMQISTTERLKNIRAFVEAVDKHEFKERPMDIAGMLDFADVVRMLDAINKADMVQIAAQQMKEAFSIALDSWTGAADRSSK